MIKAIALDLDGTLLNEQKKISTENKETLRLLKDKGYEIIIATGRAYSATKPLIEELNIPMDIICYNGAKIMNLNENKLISEKPLKESVVKKLINLSHKEKIHLNLYQNEIWYVENNLNWETEYYSKSIGMIAEKKDFLTFDNYEMTKALFIGENKDLKNLAKKLREIFGETIYMAFSQEKYLEVLDSSVNKAKSLEFLLNKKNIKMSECIAFGDAENDLEMLQEVGYGVAMGNAKENIKNKVKYIADTNENSGVSKFLKNMNLY